jgi:hypothetical protein
MAADTALLDLVTPTQGDLTGTWGNVVNNGITEYVDIAIAGTTTFNGDGAVTLVNTIGNASATNIVSTSAQYAIVRVTGTLTTPKIITFGSAGAAPYSKMYLVDNAATGDTVTFKAYGQTGVSVAVGEKCFVYYNGTDIVKATSSTADGVTTFSAGSTGLTPNSATSGAVTLAGTLAPANGGTGVSNNAASTLTISGNFATTLTVGATTSVSLPPSGSLGYLNIPQSGAAKTTSYTLAVGDVGEFIQVGSGGSIVVPDATFAAGDAVVIFNNTTGAITLTMSITTAYIGGTDADKATISLATRGICNVLFISGTVCVVTGNVT